MGQNSSSAFQRSSATRSTRLNNNQAPSHTPAAPEIPVPKTPAYVVPENKVIPNGAQDATNVRKSLRPVSQELTKFYPDFVDIFHNGGSSKGETENSQSTAMDLNSHLANKENVRIDHDESTSSGGVSTRPAGHKRHESVSAINMNTPESFQTSVRENFTSAGTPNAEMLSDWQFGQVPTVSLRRSHSMDREIDSQLRTRKHGRQLSSLSGMSIQESVIPEDPREHLFNPNRKEPFSNYQPTAASLPLKSSFEIDYAMNLTYAQLANYRRHIRVSDLEGRSGKKLEELTAEISASCTVPKSPFDRQNLGQKPSTHSLSTASSDSGVSKSKKKKAPAPPPTQEPFGNDTYLKQLYKPPADYEVDNRSPFSAYNSHHLHRRALSASLSTNIPVSHPLSKRHSSISLQAPVKNTFAPKAPPPNVFYPALSDTFSQSADDIKSAAGTLQVRSAQILPEQSSLHNSLAQAKAQLEALRKLESEFLKKPKAVDIKAAADSASFSLSPAAPRPMAIEDVDVQDADIDSSRKAADALALRDDRSALLANSNMKDSNENGSPKFISEAHEIVVSDLDLQFKSKEALVNSSPLTESPLRRMSSLLQHDIAVAAQARCAKIVKCKPPTALKMPKDPSLVFQEELAKAATAREERRQETANNKSEKEGGDDSVSTTFSGDRRIIFQSDVHAGSRKSADKTDDSRGRSSLNSENENESEKANFDSLGLAKERKKELKNNASAIENLQEGYPIVAVSVDLSKPISIHHDDAFSSISNGNAESALSDILKSTHMQHKDANQLTSTATLSRQPSEDMSISSSNTSKVEPGVDLSKRPSIQSEDMSISSDTSRRVFSSDWTPEQDLDSDDDILVENSVVAERRVSSEGFKSSIIPSKITGLKGWSKNTKKEKHTKKREEPDETTVDTASFDSLKRLSKSVHAGVRNTIGSAGKASGKFVKKQKSRDFIIREPIPQSPPTDSDYDQSEVATNSNWVLADNRGGSLRGIVSSASADQSFSNDVFESPEDSGDDTDNKPIEKKNSSIRSTNSEHNAMKSMKRAGVAYISKKGHIILLPEYERVDDGGNSGSSRGSRGHDDGRAPKLFKTKNKKFAYESTIRVQERHKLKEAIAREIEDKEKLMEVERRRQQEMERNFRRLRDLETRTQPKISDSANAVSEVAQFEQQLVRQVHNELNNNNAVSDQSFINANALPSNTTVQSHHVNNGEIKNTSQYTINGIANVGSNAYLNNSTNYSNIAPFEFQPRASIPSLPTSLSVPEPIPYPSLASFASSVNYVTLPASTVGGSSVGGNFSGSPLSPSLTAQELAYLSDYMRMMGIPPPTSQQQWAYLLNTISYNTPGYHSYDQNGFAAPGYRPGDLSSMFGNQKALNPYSRSIVSNKQPFPTSDISSLHRMQGGGQYYRPVQAQNSSDSRIPTHQLDQTSHHFSGVAVNAQFPSSSVITSMNDNNGVVRVQVPAYHYENGVDYPQTTNDNSPIVPCQNVASVVHDKMPKPVSSSAFSAQVYGPIGFRSVPFHAGSS